MKKLLNVTNHNLTLDQTEEIKTKGYEAIELPFNLRTSWSNIDITNMISIVNKISEFITVNQIDVIFTAGQMAANNLLVEKAAQAGVKSVFALTDRVSEEVILEDGSVKKVTLFKHKGFFYYPNLDSLEVEVL